MALTKDRAAITQLTASGTSTTLDLSGSYAHSLYVRHSNGTGSVTTAATFTVQVKASGGTFVDYVGPISASTTTAGADSWTITPLPADCVGVQVVYVQPSGPSGYTLDAEAGRVTAL